MNAKINTNNETEIRRRSVISLAEFAEYGPDAALKFLEFVESPDYKKSGLKLTMSQFMDIGGYNTVIKYLDFIFLHGEENPPLKDKD